MTKPSDIRCVGAELYFLPVEMRVPLKFGPEITTSVTYARVRVRVRSQDGREADGWGETPLSVQWVWPSELAYAARHEAMKSLCVRLTSAWAEFAEQGHPLEVGHSFGQQILPKLLAELNGAADGPAEPMPWLGALVCGSPFDIALHDAFGQILQKPIYETYTAEFMNRDLASYLEPDSEDVTFAGRFPNDFFAPWPPTKLAAWHLVGGLDPLDASDLTGDEPDDAYPLILPDWIKQDGLKCLKIKLRGNDLAWDYRRLVAVGKIGSEQGVEWLTADFNCTVNDPQYVNDILDRLQADQPQYFDQLLYVEQPFPYDLEANRIDVHTVSARKPLFMDESAHDWQLVRLGRQLGWTGVALKTCKTQTGALLSLCWAKAHGMALMVQDLTNAMLAQIPHVLLAAHAGTIMGVETNAMQFYPDASRAEAVVHPGLYRRRDGQVDLATVGGPGFGYRVEQIKRDLPAAVAMADAP